MIKPEGLGFHSHPEMVRDFLCTCVGPVPLVGLTLTWSVGKKLALHITLYHSLCSKHKCYTANVCSKRNTFCKELMRQVERAQRRATNFALGLPFRCDMSSQERLVKLNMLPLSYSHEYLDMCTSTS